MIVISNLVMSIVEREPSGFRITVRHYGVLALIWFATYDIYKKLLVSELVTWSVR